MRLRILIVTVGVLAASVIMMVTEWGSWAAPPALSQFADEHASAVPVDVVLALAVDVSFSMDMDELALQRQGYAEAITSREFMQALKQGIHGKVAISYFEWAGGFDQKLIVPWRLVDGPEAAGAVAAEIARTSLRRASRTSISGALAFGRKLIETSGYRGLRRVIDISGDGANNHGVLVTVARDQTIQSGITVNGLPIMIKRRNPFTMDINDLDYYYEDCVIGGPGAFVVPIKSRNEFKTAIRTKLVLEIAGRMPAARVMRAAADPPRVSCTIGERLWEQRFGG